MATPQFQLRSLFVLTAVCAVAIPVVPQADWTDLRDHLRLAGILLLITGCLFPFLCVLYVKSPQATKYIIVLGIITLSAFTLGTIWIDQSDDAARRNECLLRTHELTAEFVQFANQHAPSEQTIWCPNQNRSPSRASEQFSRRNVSP